MNAPVILVVGDGEGLGNALLYWLLKASDNCRLIGVSRRAECAVHNIETMEPSQRSRYIHLSADLMNDLAPLVTEIGNAFAGTSGALKSLMLVNGTGYLDSMVEENPDLRAIMQRLSYDAPLELIKQLQAARLMNRDTSVYYYSAVASHPSISDPNLRIHATIKKSTVKELTSVLDGCFTTVMPGAYKTEMLLRNIKRKDSILEWFTLPIADPYRKGGISNVVAQYALSSKPQPKRIIRPRSTKILVTIHNASSLKKGLPKAIQRAARGVLKQVGQSIEEHDARVMHAKELKLYGDAFDYDSIMSQKLWSEKKSLFYSKALDVVGLMK
jgi:hypothetical protein